MATVEAMHRPLLLTETYPPDRGGMAQSCDRIARGLREAGIDLDIVHFTRRATRFHVERQLGGSLVRCPVRDDPSHAINVLWTSWARHVSDRTHLIAFGGVLPILAAPSFAAWLDLPLLTLLRGNDFDTGLFSLRRGWALREALAASSITCTVTRAHETKIRRILPSSRVEHVPNGIDLADWRLIESDEARGQALRRTLGAESRRVFGVFGHIKQKKGGSLLLDAAGRSNAVDRIHFLLVGEIEPAVDEQVRTLDERLTTTRLPFLDRWELLPCFAACDLIAIPSLYDGMPNVLLEAGALGVPIVASNAGGMGDLLRDRENGLVFEAGDLHDARRALETAASAPEEHLRLLADNLRDMVRTELTAERETDRYLEVLDKASRTVQISAETSESIMTKNGDSN